MGLFASIVTTIVFICMFVPVSPFFVGKLSITMFIGWMVIGLILFVSSSVQRKGLSKAELEDGVFGKLMEAE